MGLFSKLKNVLFEEEEVEVPISEERPKKVVKEQIPKVDPAPTKMSFEESEEITPPVSERELFKAEKTFDFPVFDDKEFDTMKEKETIKEAPKSMSINLFDYEKPKTKVSHRAEPKAEEIKGRAYDKQKRDEVISSKFKPSPVISPVYGVLDKNYKKEDIEVIKEEKKSFDVDDVRKKAFGTLEEDIEKTLSKSKKEFYNLEKPLPVKEKKNEEKSIEDLLEETAYDEISIPTEKTENTLEMPILDDREEEAVEIPKTKEKQDKAILEDETIENDLFDLIDSMYENREDE